MELVAPSRWKCIDFISDLHLHASDPLTFQEWRRYLKNTIADAIFILGDLFEVWVGDDALIPDASFERQCVDELDTAGQRLDLYLMQGNRDFLMGLDLVAACSGTLLQDPSVLTFAGQRWLLSHGDAWCLSDTAYMAFRAEVRTAHWQSQFLQKPLAQRIELARAMRAQSEAHQRNESNYADIDSATAISELASTHAQCLIHGHTHRPGRHTLAGGYERLVLSDWDWRASPPRAEVLRVRQSDNPSTGGFTVERIPPHMACGASRIRPTPAG